jgi:glutamate-1-semialdehyde-2,1-aminomutase
MSKMDREPIAIIGIGCRFPGAKNKETFWLLLRDGVDAITEVPAERWDVDAFYDPDAATPDKMNTRWGGFLEDLEQFDPQFFKISPREAVSIDPQQRLLLEVAWEALEDAGQKPERLAGTRTGVFMGINGFDYYMRLMENPVNVDAYVGTGNTNCIAANRISYFFDFTGPSLGIDTACSSSLVAVHLACQSIWNGESILALAGGVRIILSPWIAVSFAKAGFMAPDGRCKTFDSRANGYVRSEGAGVVVLKPLSQALADGNPIYAVIRGSAVNQDGRSNGLTAPNPWAQEALLREAYRQAGISPIQVQYIEAHGTGTKLGDPIEMKALGKVLAEGRSSENYCMVGSVKSNIGHLEAAAGIAGLIKVALSLQHRQIPPNLHFHQPNPYIPFNNLLLRVPRTLEPYPETGGKAIAGVSSFSFGGTNAHVVLEEAPSVERKQAAIDSPCHLLTLSAKSEEALRELALRYSEFLVAHPTVSLGDVCFTASTGRSHFDHRLAIVAESTEQLIRRLDTFTAGDLSIGLASGYVRSPQRRKIAFLFTGQGAQYVSMSRQLYETQPTFRKTLEQCDRLLQPYLEKSLLSVLFSDSTDAQLLNQTVYTQPALFALEYALAQLWQSWGIVPDVVMGHSVGEYVAACVAGVFSLEDGLKLIAERGRQMQALPQEGMMAAIFAEQGRVTNAIFSHQLQVTIAAVNGPQHTVISGERTAVEAVFKQFQAEGIEVRPLQVSHAFHSPLMDSMLDAFEQSANQVQYSCPRIPIVSNLTGKIFTAEEIIDATYWRHHTREAVQFAAGMRTLIDQGYDLFLELGPHSVLSSMGKRCLGTENSTWLASMHRGQDDWWVILNSLGRLYANGMEIDWGSFHQDYQRCKIPLPTYPFQRKRHWIESVETMNTPVTTSNSHAKVTDLPTDTSHKVILGNGTTTAIRREKICSALFPLIGRWLHIDNPTELDIYANLLDLGADSISLLEAVRSLEKKFGVKVEIRQFFEELQTIDALITYLEQNSPLDWASEVSPQPELKADEQSQQPELEPSNKFAQSVVQPVQPIVQPTASFLPMAVSFNGAIQQQMTRLVSESPLTGIIGQQLQLMSQQMELLRSELLRTEQLPTAIAAPRLQSIETTDASVSNSLPAPTAKTAPPALTPNQAVAKPQPTVQQPVPYRSAPSGRGGSLNPQQQQYLDTFIARYTKRTPGSKKEKQTYHPVLADRRAAARFRPFTKEIIYPIVGQRSQGSRIWDIDGNEYIDLSMGFGVHLLGHSPPFIIEALEAQIKEGIQIGPQSRLAGEVAQMICELTGMERAAFSNTGTEAVMIALRLARGVTGRSKIALFSGSYHGQSDGSLFVLSQTEDGKPSALPLTGVPKCLAEDTLILKYGDPQALELIQANAKELAAVLVEPVQSDHPDVQPKEFLQDLRELTTAHNIVLIFDEVITGFRLHLGGAQAWYGIKADLATYGKVVGGGMPIGVVAGKAKYMNGMDGGAWNYGDQSRPQPGTIFYGGTFNKNPLTTAAAKAALKYLKEQGSALQQTLNQRTARLAKEINTYFQQQQVPIQVLYCGSLFRFSVLSNSSTFENVDRLSDLNMELDLFHYHMIEKGVYIWEGRNLFLSTAHTDDDIDYVIEAVKKSVEEMRAGGFFLTDPELSLNGKQHSGSIAKKTASPQMKVADVDNRVSRETTTADRDLSLLKVLPAPEQRHLPFPLTDIQQAYWLGQSNAFELGNLRAHTYDEYEVFDLDIDRCHRVLQRLIERHDMLRAIVLPDGQQQILEQVPTYQIELVDLRGKEPQVVADYLEFVRQRMSQDGLTTDQWPLFEIKVHRLDERCFRVHFSVSLMILDGLSDSIVTQEFCQLYQNPDAYLAPLELSYRDYVLALSKLQDSEAYQGSLKYWQHRLSTLPSAPELPLAKSPASVSQPRFVRRTGRLEPETWLRLRTRAIRAGLTPTNALCAAYCEVLAAWSKTRHFTLNILFFNRMPLHPQVNDVVGNFSSTILLEVDNSGHTSFANRAKRLQSQLLTDLKHSDISGVEVLRQQSSIEGRTSRAAMPIVFTSSLNLNSQGNETVSIPLSGKVVCSSLQTPQVQLDHEVYEQNGALLFNWDAVEELFPEGMVEDMFCAYSRLLHRLADEEEVWQETTPQLLPSAQLQQRIAINATDAPVPAEMLHTLFAEQVPQRSHQTAVVSARKILTYEELYRRSNQVARWLRQLGARSNVLVAVVMEKGWEQVVAVLGVLQSGAAYLPIDPALPKERLWYLLTQSEVGLALTQSWLDEKLEWPENVQRLCVDCKDVEKLDHQPLELVQKPEDLAYVIFTSGSTGLPKGVMIDHHGAVNTICDINQRFGIGPEDRLLALSSLSFDLSVYDVFGTLAAGGTIIIPPASAVRDPGHLAELLVREKVTIWNSVPALMQMLVDYAKSRPDISAWSLRLVLLSGDWISVMLPDQIKALFKGVQVISLGGATEASIWSILYPIEEVDPAQKSIPYGTPMTNQRFHVLNEALEPCPVWVVGHLYIEGIGLAKGYWQDEEKTNACFIKYPKTGERLYHTGDLGRYLPDGNIEFLGREDFQVKVQGYRIELGEIETTLRQHPAVRSVFATVVGEPHDTKRLVAYAVVDQELMPDISELRSFLAKKLPEYMMPSAFVLLDTFPLTPNGKVNRKALPVPEQAVLERKNTFVAPCDPLELQLAQIWEELLDIHPVGVQDNFFELGGNSLLAVRLIAQIQKRFKKELSLSTLLQGPTIEHLASVLREQTAFLSRSSLVEIQRTGSKQPFFCIHPVGGNVLCYIDLVHHLGLDQPFYGLQSAGLDGEREPFTQIEDMAAHYIEAVRTIQPQGPYLLGGWSMGGIVAFEVAQQLLKQDQEVPSLVLLDSRVPGSTPNLDDTTLLKWFVRDLGGRFGKNVTVSHEELQQLGLDAGLHYILEQARKTNILPPDVEMPQIQRLLQVFKANTRAMWNYRPKPYPSPVILIRPNEVFSEDFDDFGDPSLGWEKFARRLEIHTVPGNHYTVLANPHVKVLAERLRHCLDLDI